MTGFEFPELDPSTDSEIDLVLKEWEPANLEKGYVLSYHFWIVPHGSAGRVGALRFRVGTVEHLFFLGHIGYEVDPPFRGNHFAERACRIAAPLVMAHGLSSVILTCRPDNMASRRTIERLGAKLLGQFEVPPTHELYPMYAREGWAPILRFEWGIANPAPRP